MIFLTDPNNSCDSGFPGPVSVDCLSQTDSDSDEVSDNVETMIFASDPNDPCDPQPLVLACNQPPIADAGGPYSGDEGSNIALDASGSTDPDGMIVSYEWDLDNDGMFDDATGVSTNVSFDDNGIFTVGVRVTDDDGATDETTAQITVNNVPPSVSAGSPVIINEGDDFSGSGSFTDPGADIWTATVDYGDGGGPQALALNPDKSFSIPTHTYVDDDADDTYTVTVEVTDDDGGVGSASFDVTVLNVPPSVSACESSQQHAGETYTDPGSFTDPGINDVPWIGTVDYGEGAGPQALALANDKTYNLSHQYNDAGIFTITVEITDKDGGVGSNSCQVLVLPESIVTSSSLEIDGFDVDSDTDGQQFRLIFTNDPTNIGEYKQTASNPGQIFYNVFKIGTPGDPVSLDFKIPFPMVTKGSEPIHVYKSVDIVNGFFVPLNPIEPDSITGTDTTTPSGALGIELDDHSPEDFGGLVTVTVTGTIPDTGLFYTTVHLNYGLKKTVGYTPIIDLGAQSADHTILNLADYDFAVMGDLTDTQTVQNLNVFKNDPGFTGIVTNINNDNPVQGVTVEFYKPDGSYIGNTETDENGYFFYYYKHKGKAADYTVKLPDYGLEDVVTLKAVKFTYSEFQIDPKLI